MPVSPSVLVEAFGWSMRDANIQQDFLELWAVFMERFEAEAALTKVYDLYFGMELQQQKDYNRSMVTRRGLQRLFAVDLKSELLIARQTTSKLIQEWTTSTVVCETYAKREDCRCRMAYIAHKSIANYLKSCLCSLGSSNMTLQATWWSP